MNREAIIGLLILTPILVILWVVCGAVVLAIITEVLQ